MDFLTYKIHYKSLFLWLHEQAISVFTMSDDDFMCDDDEEYDLVRVLL